MRLKPLTWLGWFMLMLSLSVAWVQFTPHTPSIATVHLTALIQQKVKALVKQTQSPNALQQDVQQFAQDVKRCLQQLAHDKHLVIVLSEAVVAGGIDVSAELNHRLQHAKPCYP